MIIAVDFDGTLSNGQLFEEMSPNMPLILKLIEYKKEGHKLILWTCRGGEWLQEAIDFCREYSLEFDAVNENITGNSYINISCKVVADVYIDDKNISIKNFVKDMVF